MVKKCKNIAVGVKTLKVTEYFLVETFVVKFHSHSEFRQNENISDFNFEGGCPWMGRSMGWRECTNR